jgi:hypothetical protein
MSEIYDLYGLPSELQGAADLVSKTLDVSL